LRYYPDDAELLRLTRAAVERGFAIAVHAMGNEAVAQALRLYAAVGARHTALVPPRVEHAMLAGDAQLRRARDLGVAVVVQPPFLSIPAAAGVPPLPGIHLFGFRSMLDAGLQVAGSSDAPVAGFAPLDAFRDARFRRDAEGVPTRPEEGVTGYEALAMYTREGARACGSLTTAGTLEPGKRADLVVLSCDPCTASEEELRATRVVETVVGGETVWAE
jgi:predicted amidohydrolase YtcJ